MCSFAKQGAKEVGALLYAHWSPTMFAFANDRSLVVRICEYEESANHN